MRITRHYLTIGTRRVHYRRCGNGPPLLMVHQSPRSSAEYEPLMQQWGAHFTCIAPDTPGFGQSDPLPIADPDINDYADAICDFVAALGLTHTLAYGFHSGGIILVTAIKRRPDLFAALAVGGYAIWTPEEMAIFGDSYLPPFLPSAYGEHLTWLWNRVLEQSWVFPWFDARDEARLSVAHADPARVHAVVMEMLDAGDAYRLGYGAVLRAPRDIPPPDAVTPPVLITAYDGDPLQAHLARLGTMPANWSADSVTTPQAHWDASLAHLQAHRIPAAGALAEDSDAGFIAIKTAGFDGLIHWQGPRGASTLALPAPGQEASLIDCPDAICIDLPGHGLSDGWPSEPPSDWRSWANVIVAVATQLGTTETVFPPLPTGDPDRLYPDLSPDRFGGYLTNAWSITRARHFFAPWYAANANAAIPIDASALAPAKLAREHRALIRSSGAKAYHLALTHKGDLHGLS
jgi:haloalkane dehalogenase